MPPRKPQKPEIINLGQNMFDLNGVRLPWRLLIIGAVGIVLVLWFALGGPVYTVAADEVGVVLTFGKYSGSSTAGLHFKMPWPVQTVELVNVAQVNRLEVGLRSRTQGGRVDYVDFTQDRSLLDEAQMLTGDENVVNVSMVVQYRIRNELDYLFNFRHGEVEQVLRSLAEAGLRQAVGDHPIDAVLTEGKSIIRMEIQEQMQQLSDMYGMGLQITEVQLQDVKPPEQVRDAFQGVASAREMREQIINESRAYESERLPRSEGEAQRIILESRGYQASQVAQAQGEVARFKAISREFEASPEIARARMYLETMYELLPHVRLTLIDEGAQLVNLKAVGGNVPALPLHQEPQND